MTITTLVVLMTALADHKSGLAQAPPASRAGATCTIRVVRVAPTFDAGILAPRPKRFGDALVEDDAMVRDSVSACAGASTRRVSGAGTGER